MRRLFMAPNYFRAALGAGLKTFPAVRRRSSVYSPKLASADFASEHSELMKDYLEGDLHALALLIYRRDEAMEIITQEPMRLMKIADVRELRRQVDSIAELFQVKPYPTIEAILNTNEIAAQEYGRPASKIPDTLGPALA